MCDLTQSIKSDKLNQPTEEIRAELQVTLQPNTLQLIDCMDFMRECPSNYFDLAIVDPQYGIKNMTAGGRGMNGWTKFENKEWDNEPPNKDYFTELFRVSKNQIIWGGNYFTEHLPPTMGWIFWDKGQRDFSLADGELAWTSYNKALRVIDYPRGAANQEDKIHPTQKPVEIYRRVLKLRAKQGDKILDTHVGSGSSLVACKELGFEYYGCEIDEEYFAKANERIARAYRKYELFE